jgi:hypothetical protein
VSLESAPHGEIGDVVITPDLWRRRSDDVDPVMLDKSRRKIAAHLTSTRQELLQALTEVTLDLCSAHTAGFSVLYCDNGEECFQWDAMAGVLKHAVGGRTPRKWSPCGTTLDRQSPQLFCCPGKVFECLSKANPPIVEGLVLPVFISSHKPLGTLWIVSHDSSLKFHPGHVQIMNSLVHFCAAAITLMSPDTGVTH